MIKGGFSNSGSLYNHSKLFKMNTRNPDSLIEVAFYFFMWFFTGVDPSDRNFITQEFGQKIYERLISE